MAENAAVLDMLSNGRLRLGLGRGLARREFEIFGISMDESRERFDESAPMIIEALKTGFIEGDGTYYKQPARKSGPGRSIPSTGESTPSPLATNRLSPQPNLAHISLCSLIALGKCGCRGSSEVVPYTGNITARSRPRYCSPNSSSAALIWPSARKKPANIKANSFESNFYHYEFLGDHFKTIKGYDAYQQKIEIARSAGHEGAVNGFMKAASWGTPDKILRGLEDRRDLLGNFEVNVSFRFGGTPYDISERGLKLFAKEVLPVLKSW